MTWTPELTDRRISCDPLKLYSGLNTKYELKGGFQPATKYLFRVSASNLNGCSPLSSIVEYQTPAATPSAVAGLRLDEAGHDSLVVSWRQPNANGSDILFYNLDFSDDHLSSFSSSTPYLVVHDDGLTCSYTIRDLKPDTNYK